MTQDQYGQPRDSGHVVHGQVVGDEIEESADDEGKPMTRFQKVASALRGDRPDHEEPDTDVQDQAPAYPDGGAPDPSGARPEETAAPNVAGVGRDDYWDAPAASGPAGTLDPTPTQPNVYGAAHGTRADVEDHADSTNPATTTMPDVPAAQMPGDVPVVQTLADVPVVQMPGDGPAVQMPGDGPAVQTPGDGPVVQTPGDGAVAEAPAGAGRHAAAAQDTPGMRPGDASGTLENLGDLAYADLLPDASVYIEQWQQIQFKFVDDPHASVTEAADVVAQVTAKLEAAIQERQRAIEARQRAIAEQQRSLRGRWGEGTQADTETLRETLRMYKAFLDQLVGPKV